jgi:hypothetical protein
MIRPLSDHHVAEIDEGLEQLPEHLRGGLRRYLVERICPGQFLQAVLRNDLRAAVGRADDVSLPALKDIIEFLYNVAPGGSWGSPDALKAWIEPAKAEALP